MSATAAALIAYVPFAILSELLDIEPGTSSLIAALALIAVVPWVMGNRDLLRQIGRFAEIRDEEA